MYSWRQTLFFCGILPIAIPCSEGQEIHGEDTAAMRLRTQWRDAIKELTQERVTQLDLRDSADIVREKWRAAVLASSVPFLEPTAIRSNNGFFAATLDVAYGNYAIGGNNVRLRTYNGRLVGPTFRVRPGDALEVRLRNQLPPEPPHHGDHNQLHGFNTTNLHTHGLHVSPKGRSDNVFLRVGPGEEFDYRIEIPDDHPPGTFWYHAHSHGSTAAHVSSGMSGAIIIEGGLDNVTEIAPMSEKTMIFQQIPFIMEHGRGVIEERYADLSFGPGSWDSLGRHTTINGQQFPVIQMRAGEVQRWRLIHSGVREGIGLKVIGVEGQAEGTNAALYEIAWDGLAIGKKKSPAHSMVQLFPGYRSDVLVKVEKPGTYLLTDVLIPNVAPFTQNPAFHPKYLAKIVVRPARQNEADMPLPDDTVLAAHKPFRPIGQAEITGTQEATYRIGGDPLFTIDGRAFSKSFVRQLKLNDVEEWTLKSVGAPVDHPFHIHVNPFQIVSAVDAEGNDHPEEHGWRDTLLLRHNWTYKMRTRYRVFTGRFVQHCHVLDHEDQGMMELVEIVP